MMLMITALGNVCNEAVFSCHSVYSAVMQCHLQQLRFPMSLRDGDIVTLTKWHIFTCSEKTQICDTRIARSKIAKYIYQIYIHCGSKTEPMLYFQIISRNIDISWAVCKPAPCSRQITMSVPNDSSFLQATCPSCQPTNSVKALKAIALKVN